MSRAVRILRGVAWWTVALASLVWWTPAIVLALLAGACERLCFPLVMLMASALRKVGAVGAARGVYLHERDRCDRRMAAIRARRAHFTSARDEA